MLITHLHDTMIMLHGTPMLINMRDVLLYFINVLNPICFLYKATRYVTAVIFNRCSLCYNNKIKCG